MNISIDYNHYLDPDLIIKESEVLYFMVKTLKLRVYKMISVFLKIFGFFPHLFDVVSYVVFRINLNN